MEIMKPGANNIKLSLLARLVRAYIRSNLRGCTRLSIFLADKFKSLQFVPVALNDRYPIYVDLRADMSHYWLGGSPWPTSPFELDEQLIMTRIVRQGDTAFDIGANLGLYTTLLSRLVGPDGKVCAFEPNPRLIPLLEKTVAALDNSKLFPFALSDNSGESTLYVPNDHSMGSLADYTSDPNLKEWRAQIGLTPAEALKCELKTLDSLVALGSIPLPDFIKCDVEGAEAVVFKGGRQALDRIDAPFVMFESREECSLGFGLAKSAALDFLSSLPKPGYRFFEVQEGGILSEISGEEYDSPNLLAVPQSKLARIDDNEAASDADESSVLQNRNLDPKNSPGK